MLKDARLKAEAHAIRRELGLLYRDVERLSQRVTSLDRHFGQAQKDIEEIRISSDKAQGRARRLEAIDFTPEGDTRSCRRRRNVARLSDHADWLSPRGRGRLRRVRGHRGDSPWHS